MTKKSQRAALYCRSSKDRSDVSIDSQRRELQRLATDRGLAVVQEYLDVVESAKGEQRPGFQQLLRDLKSPGRQWDALLMVDTSRLSRRRYVAQVFKHEARKRNVEIIYSKVPEVDPITNVVLEAVFEAFDEVHSLMSKEKGLAGMAENIRQGFRAGGRAPRGYRLRAVSTGAVRDGELVSKSVLELSTESTIVARYLKGRAGGRSREALRQELGIKWPDTSLVGMEWNALTYAGHTVWNVHNEYLPGEGYKGGEKRRARDEWMIQRETHPALITDEEAEAIVAQLEASKCKRIYRGKSPYLLAGLLKTPAGDPWHGDSADQYRARPSHGRGRRILKKKIEDVIVGQVLADMQSREFVQQLTAEARRFVLAQAEDPAAELRQRIQEITNQIGKATDLVLKAAHPEPLLRKVDELESQRKVMAVEIERLEHDYQIAMMMREVTEEQVSKLLATVVAELRESQPATMKDVLNGLLEQITLDPASLECRIHYRIGLSGDLMASPWVCKFLPVFLRTVSRAKVA